MFNQVFSEYFGAFPNSREKILLEYFGKIFSHLFNLARKKGGDWVPKFRLFSDYVSEPN